MGQVMKGAGMDPQSMNPMGGQGGQGLGQTVANPGAAVSGVGGGGGGGMFGGMGEIAADLGLSPKNAIKSLDSITGLAQNQYDATAGVNAKLNKSGDKYVKALGQDTDTFIGQVGDATTGYQGTQQGLANAATASGKDLKNQFGVQDAAMGTLQDQTMGNAGQAMSLADAGNVNNSQHTQTRNLYNQEGDTQRNNYNSEGANRRSAHNAEGDTQEAAYEQKAQGVGREGLASAGMLASLGGQAMAGQMGGAAPMTGGQLSAMQGANMSRAGQAYGRAQQQMQGLRDQGMGRKMNQRDQGMATETAARGQGLQNQSAMRGRGIEQGYNQSEAQYGRGQNAIGAAAGMVGQRSGMQNAYQGMQQGLRGEESAYGGNIYNAGMTQAGQQFGAQQNYQGAKLGNSQDQGGREIANIQGLYQPQMSAAGQKANIYGQHGVGMMGMYGDIAQGIGNAIPG
jgi:hypothetical protein